MATYLRKRKQANVSLYGLDNLFVQMLTDASQLKKTKDFIKDA